MSSEFIAHSVYQSDHSNPLRFIWSHIKRHPWAAILMIVGAFSNASLASTVPYLIGKAINAIIERNDLQFVGLMALAIVGSQLLRGALQLMRNYSSEIFAQRIERDVRDELYASLLGKSMAFHDFQPVGEIMARVTNDVREMNLMMNPGVNLVIGSGMFLVLPLIASPLIYPALITVPLVFAIFYILVQVGYVRSLHGVAQQVRASFGRMNARLAETLDGIEVVKGTAQEEQEVGGFKTLVDTVRDRFIEQGDIEARYFANLLLGLATLAGLIHSVILYRAGAINAGDIVAFMGQLSLFGFPVFSSMNSLSRLASGYASAQRILDIITARTDLDQNEGGYDQPMKGAITFEGVDFGHSDDQHILRGFRSLSILDIRLRLSGKPVRGKVPSPS